MNEQDSRANAADPAETYAQKDNELLDLLRETFDSFLREAKLVRTYSKLYDERTKIGVSEGFAMVNQRDAEVRAPNSVQNTSAR